MSNHQGRGTPGRRRLTDEESLSPEAIEKKRKNREAAKKHREKKVNTMKDLESKNKELETKNKDYLKQRETLQQKIKDYIKLFRKHLAAGCKLPPELESVWDDLMKESFLNEDDMDTSTQNTSISNGTGDCNSIINGGHANVAQMGLKLSTQNRRVESSLSMSTTASSPGDDSHSDNSTPEPAVATDQAVAQSLFSGAPLQTPTPTGRHHPYHGRRTPLQGRQPVRSIDTTRQEGKMSVTVHSPPMNESINGSAAMISINQSQQGIVDNQNLQFTNSQVAPTFVVSNQLGQNSQVAMAVDEEGHTNTSDMTDSPSGVTQNQDYDNSQSTSLSPVNGQDEYFYIRLENGELVLVARHFIEQHVNIHVPQVQQSQPVNVSEPSITEGNLPIPDLLGSFADSYLPSENSKVEEPSLKEENDVALDGSAAQEIAMKAAVGGQPSEIVGYSYTNDLNQSETPQSILRQVQQEHQSVGQSSSRAMAQNMSNQVAIHSDTISSEGSIMDTQSTHQYIVNSSNKQRATFGEFTNVHIKQVYGQNPHTSRGDLMSPIQATTPQSRSMVIANPSVEVETISECSALTSTHPQLPIGFHSSAALLEMLHKKEVSPALQDQIKASLSQPVNTTVSSDTSQTLPATTHYQVTDFTKFSGGNAVVVHSTRDGSTRNAVGHIGRPQPATNRQPYRGNLTVASGQQPTALSSLQAGNIPLSVHNERLSNQSLLSSVTLHNAQY